MVCFITPAGDTTTTIVNILGSCDGPAFLSVMSKGEFWRNGNILGECQCKQGCPWVGIESATAFITIKPLYCIKRALKLVARPLALSVAAATPPLPPSRVWEWVGGVETEKQGIKLVLWFPQSITRISRHSLGLRFAPGSVSGGRKRKPHLLWEISCLYFQCFFTTFGEISSLSILFSLSRSQCTVKIHF